MKRILWTEADSEKERDLLQFLKNNKVSFEMKTYDNRVTICNVEGLMTDKEFDQIFGSRVMRHVKTQVSVYTDEGGRPASIKVILGGDAATFKLGVVLDADNFLKIKNALSLMRNELQFGIHMVYGKPTIVEL